MFDRSKCDLCGDCIVECKYTDYDRESAIAEITALIEGRPTNIVKECITCVACNEICEKGANPFDLICETQEKTNALEVPEAVVQMFALGFTIYFKAYGNLPFLPAGVSKWITVATIYFALVMTLLSAVSYIGKARKVFATGPMSRM